MGIVSQFSAEPTVVAVNLLANLKNGPYRAQLHDRASI